MRKTGLEKAIDSAVAEFTDLMLDAVREMPLEELAALRGEDLVVRPEPVEIEPPKEGVGDDPAPAPAKKKVHPPCVYPGCTKNRFVRGRGYCGKHFRQWRKGKIEDPKTYADQQNTSELLSVKEVSALLEIPEHTIRRLHSLGQLDGQPLGPRRLRFTRSAVEEWARSPECKKIRHRRARRAWRSRAGDEHA